MKKVLALMLALCMVFLMAACAGTTKTDSTTAPADNAETNTESTEKKTIAFLPPAMISPYYASCINGALYVSLYEDKADDPFAQQPGALNASDGLHPSDAGYQLWYDELNAQAAMGRRLAALRWATH